MSRGTVVSVNVSDTRGVPKERVDGIEVAEGFGLEGDAHGGDWHRQVSLLAEESLERMKRAGTRAEPGLYGENVTTRGIELVNLEVGASLRLGREVVLEVTQIRKSIDDPTAVYYREGDRDLPLDVVFASVVRGGSVAPGDEVEVIEGG